ncbi:MAG: type 1 glutamine amidotransferase [Syntrophobacterales bacterium]|nr:MAG: type 1 glutamine amidotransferase [Syntrophobacterales bacterium]
MIVIEKTLIITHVESEGPGTLGEFLASQKIDITRVNLSQGEVLPKDPLEYDAIITMGGPIGVHDGDRSPFLNEEIIFLRKAIEYSVPLLGICLGAQLIARACDAWVRKANKKELGWKNVFITEEGKKDMLFQGIPEVISVFQWHEDTFDIPQGATFLATGWNCENQAFRYGNAFGLQFHVEVTREMLYEWFEGSPELDQILDDYEEINTDLITRARTLYSNFLWLSDIRKRAWAGQGGRGR